MTKKAGSWPTPGGAIVEDITEDSTLVKMPSWMVDKARATLPSGSAWSAPGQTGNRKYIMDLYKNQIYYGTGSDTPFTIDPYTGARRATYKDVKNLAKLAEALPNVDFFMSLGITQDTAVGTYDRWQYLAMLEGTNKPINITAVDMEGLQGSARDGLHPAGRQGGVEEGAVLLALHRAGLAAEPFQGSGAEAALLRGQRHPLCLHPVPDGRRHLARTLAGTLVQALTESLFGIVLSQLRKPGARSSSAA